MTELLRLATTFPTVVFTVLVGVVLVYWAFVMLGALELDALGGAHHAHLGDVGHDLGDVGHGLLHGGHDVGCAAHGALDAGHDVGDASDGDTHGDHGGQAAHAAHSAGLLEALRLRSAPVTVVASLVVVFAWLASALLSSWFGSPLWLARAAIFAGSFVFGVLATSVAVRPLARLFVTRKARGNADLVGKVCVVRTGEVTESFGEGVLDEGGASLVLRIRLSEGERLARGEEALILEWDARREAFLVAPFGDVLARSERRPPKR